MIKQTKDYIRKQKKKYLIHACIWGGIICVIFSIGLIVMSTRESKFTLVAALFVLPFGLHLTQYIAYIKYRDPDIKNVEILECMKGTYAIYHSAIIPDTTGTFYFPHLIVTSKHFYFLTQDEEMITKAKATLDSRLKAKGLLKSQLCYMHIGDEVSLKNIAIKIQKDACFSDEQLGNNTNIIDAIIM